MFTTLMLVLLGGPSIAQPAAIEDDAVVLAAFRNRVAAYVALHRRLEGPLPTLEVSDDPERIHFAMDALAHEIRRVRWNAKQGDIADARTAVVLRRAVATAVAEQPALDLYDLIAGEYPPGMKIRPVVNARMPAVLGPGMVPPCVLRALPELPEELQYRFIGRDLVLWDVHANLIVDIVSDAVPAVT